MALPGEPGLFERPSLRIVKDVSVRTAALAADGALTARNVSRRAGNEALTQIKPAWAWVANSWLGRTISRSLRRRIMFSNLIGLALLVFGWILLSQQNIWLIDTKRSALETQARIIAATVSTSETRSALNPDGAPTDPYVDVQPTGPLDSKLGLAELDLSIKPERVSPILSNVIKGTGVRARIYSLDGHPIFDSNHFDLNDGISGLRPQPVGLDQNGEDSPQVKPKNFWTRALSWRVQSELTVYEDIEGINGLSFREVRTALETGDEQAMILMTSDGDQTVGYVAPIKLLDKVQGVLLLSTKPGEIDDLLFDERSRILLLALLAFCATLAVSLLLAQTVAGPMRRLSAAAERVTQEIGASEELPKFPNREDEIGQLARSFATMTAALRRRIEASEKFAADVAHELKNPLAAARSTAESLTYARTEAQRDDLVQTITGELARLNRLITDVSNASRLDAELARQELEPTNIAVVARGVVDTFSDLISDDPRNLSVVFDLRTGNTPTLVRGHEGRLGQVLTNLIDNALSFSPENGSVRLSLSETRDGSLQIDIEDDGPGIDAGKLETIFTRFYTFRPTENTSRGANSGLGLSISREIIEAHGGRIWAENRPDRGARFTIQLPRETTARPNRWVARRPQTSP